MAAARWTTLPIEQRRSENGQELVCHWQIPENLAYFRGHFTQTPIVPGVALTHWAIRTSCEHFDQAPHVASIANLKFHHVLTPSDEVTLTLQHNPEAGSTRFRYAQGERAYASGRINWR